MAAPYADPRPPFEKIAADLRAEIMSGEIELGPDNQLPTIDMLLKRFKVANPTVQKALDQLKVEGLVVGRRGTGIFVQPPQIVEVEADAYFDPRTTDYSYSILEVGERIARGDVGRLLGLPGGSGVALLRHRRMDRAAQPLELSWSYYPIEIARGTALAEFKKPVGGAPAVLASLGYAEWAMSDVVSARAATTYELESLELPPDTPVLRTLRKVVTAEDVVIEVSVLVKGAHLRALRYHRELHD